MEKQLQVIIEAFESGNISIEKALNQIFECSGNHVDEDLLRNYWTSESMESLCKRLAMRPIENWQGIDENQAISLLKEILSDVTNDAIIHRNSLALEKRYSKPTGTITQYIFQEDLSVEQMMVKLKEDTTFYL